MTMAVVPPEIQTGPAWQRPVRFSVQRDDCLDRAYFFMFFFFDFFAFLAGFGQAFQKP
jgi:hypothetical protein